MIFGYDQIQEIHARAVSSGLHLKRDLMLAGINGDYVATLRGVGNPADQMLADLFAIDRTVKIIGGEVPLERWLRNAAYDTRLYPDTHQYFADLAAQANSIATAQKTPVAGASAAVTQPVPRTVWDPQRQPDASTSLNPGIGYRNVGIALTPLLVLCAAVVLDTTGSKGWHLLSPVASALAIWMLFRYWWPDPAVRAADDTAVSDHRHESEQVGVLLAILSIAASGLLLQFS